MPDISERLLHELVYAVKDIVRKEQSDRLRDVYLIGDIEKDAAKTVIVSTGVQVTIVVQGMACSMGPIVLQAASPGRRLAFPHSWIMIREPSKWAGWQSTSAAAQHLGRLKQMQTQIYKILAAEEQEAAGPRELEGPRPALVDAPAALRREPGSDPSVP